MTSTTPWSSESSSKTKEMGSHSLSLAMILTCCRPCLSNVYLNSLGKKRRAKNKRQKENGFRIVRNLYWERQYLLHHYLNNNLDSNCYTKQNVIDCQAQSGFQEGHFLPLPYQTTKYITKGNFKNIWFLYNHNEDKTYHISCKILHLQINHLDVTVLRVRL